MVDVNELDEKVQWLEVEVMNLMERPSGRDIAEVLDCLLRLVDKLIDHTEIPEDEELVRDYNEAKNLSDMMRHR